MKTEMFSNEVVSPVRFHLVMEKTSKPLTTWMNGFTTDVSLGGVKIIALMSEAKVEMLVRQYVRVKLSLQLPGTPKAITAIATIVDFRRGETVSKAISITFGVSFVAIDYSARDVIGEFICQNINSPTSNKIYHIQDKKRLDAQMKPQILWMA